MLVVSGTAAIDIAREIAKRKKYKLIIPFVKTFHDGEQYIRIDENVNDDILLIQSFYHPQDSHLFQALNMISTLKRLGAGKISLFAPYLCYARADREVLRGEGIAARTVLQLFEAVGLDRLITLDVHNPKIFDYTSIETVNIYPVKSIKYHLEYLNIDYTDFMIVAPDKGALSRAKLLANELDIPYTSLSKVRDPHTNKAIVSIKDAKIVRKKVILVDDIMSTGSSLVQASLLLQLHDVEIIHTIVTHALGTASVDRLKNIGNGIVISTLSVPGAIASIMPVEELIELI